jgi:hypothetical protein
MRQDDSGRNIRHFSGPAQCPRSAAAGIISAVERDMGSVCLRSVLWCSLRGSAQWCGEECLAACSGRAPRPPS